MLRCSQVALEDGKVNCDECGEGLYAVDTHDACAGCPAGTYGEGGSFDRLFYDVSEETYHQCFNCSAGTYSHSDGAAECIPCMGGSIAPRDGMTTCHECPVGHHAHTHLECLLCMPGEHANVTGLEECDPCPDGCVTVCLHDVAQTPHLTPRQPAVGALVRYTSGPGAEYCDACPVGTHWESLTGAYVDHVYCDDDQTAYWDSASKTCTYDGEAIAINDFLYGGWNLTCLDCKPGKYADEEATVEVSRLNKQCNSHVSSSSLYARAHTILFATTVLEVPARSLRGRVGHNSVRGVCSRFGRAESGPHELHPL